MLTAFSLFPTDAQFYEMEELCHVLPSSVTDQPVSSANVDPQLYASLLELVSCVRSPELDVHIGWDAGLKLAAVRRLEETGLRFDVMTNTFAAVDKSADVRIGRAAGKAAVCASGTASGDDVHGGKRELGRSAVPTAAGFTLDDIQQVLSAANCPLPGIVSSSVTCGGAGNGDAAADERALKEITAYLQSEIGTNKLPQDAPSRGSDFSAYSAGASSRPSAAPTRDGSGVVVRLIPPTANEAPRTGGEPRGDEVRQPTDAGGTILVTDSNLPYLQQFLPNLQTVMQSVQSLVRCVPPSTAAGPDSQHRSMSVPSLATCRSHDAPPDTGTAHKKRKQSGHGSQAKLDSVATTNLVNSFALPPKDFPAKSGELKMEADSAASAGEGGFACGLCSRTFTKRLGLSVHIQRAHGRRRSSESVELTTTGLQFADKPADPAEDATVKNCLVKAAARADVCAMVGDAPPASAICMCDVCGEIVLSLEAHAAVCAGRQSPAKFVGRNSVANVDKSDPAPAVSANTAVAEMLQLAEHFLRQHVPTGSVGEQTPSAPPSVEQVQMMSPPPYSEAELHVSNLQLPPAAFSGSPRITSNGPGVPPGELVPHSASQPPGKEIIYEGSRMREFVEYQCEACLLTFGSSALANAHIADHHTTASVSAYRVYACLSCSLRYRDPRIMRHHVVYLCGGSRTQAGAQSKQQLFPCSFCPKTFMTAEYQQLHVRLRHSAHPVSSAAVPVQCVLPTPPGATSVPSLEQLVSHFRHHPAAAGARVSVGQLNPSTATGAASTGSQEASANHKESFMVQNKGPVTSITHDHVTDVDASKAVSHGQLVVDGRQCNAASAAGEAGKSRSSKAKGILYKNVFMQCEGTYYCSVCHADLTGRESKRRHKQLPCGDPKTASYSRRYSYVCPYCSEKFPSQKLCRQHQIDECLPLIGVGTAELGVGESRCPLCPKTCFGFPALKGHVVQVHHLPKEEVSKLLAEHEPAVPTCAAVVADHIQEFNGVLSPAISSPSSVLSATTSTFVTQTTTSPAVHSVNENISHGDGLESDDDLPEPEQPKELFPQLYESIISDDVHQPSEDVARPKRNRKSRTNEFFVMMFRNYPILAKGVSMCRSCATQLEPNATAESHAGTCTGTAAVDVRRSTLFRCTHCTATFWRAKDCRTHQLESCLPAHGVKIERLTEPSVACPMCEVRSYNRSGLMSHMKFRHSLDTDGVRQVMDRCGIRKSVPPAADHIIPTRSPSQEYDDGSLSMDDIAMQCNVSCDSVMPVQCVSAAETAQSSSSAADMLVDGELPPVDDVANDSTNTWRTGNMVLQRSSADVCGDLK